jgi:hypothetical protein
MLVFLVFGLALGLESDHLLSGGNPRADHCVDLRLDPRMSGGRNGNAFWKFANLLEAPNLNFAERNALRFQGVEGNERLRHAGRLDNAHVSGLVLPTPLVKDRREFDSGSRRKFASAD